MRDSEIAAIVWVNIYLLAFTSFHPTYLQLGPLIKYRLRVTFHIFINIVANQIDKCIILGINNTHTSSRQGQIVYVLIEQACVWIKSTGHIK